METCCKKENSWTKKNNSEFCVKQKNAENGEIARMKTAG